MMSNKCRQHIINVVKKSISEDQKVDVNNIIIQIDEYDDGAMLHVEIIGTDLIAGPFYCPFDQISRLEKLVA